LMIFSDICCGIRAMHTQQPPMVNHKISPNLQKSMRLLFSCTCLVGWLVSRWFIVRVPTRWLVPHTRSHTSLEGHFLNHVWVWSLRPDMRIQTDPM
jgi:hypothetical protein